MKAVILAGGFGTRLASDWSRSNSLHGIGRGRRLLDHQIEQLRKAGIADIRLSLHYKADEVRAYARKFGDGVECVYEPEP